jgi:hypothetical protein
MNTKNDDAAFNGWVSATISGLLDPVQENAEPVAEQSTDKDQKPSEAKKAYVCGVYVLMEDGVVMYVGQSTNVYQRIAQHMNMAPFSFTDFVVIECDKEQLLHDEAKYIHEYQPKWNKDIPAYGGKKYEYRKHAVL